MNPKRKKIEETIYHTFDLLDKTGTNTKFYKELFGAMSDAQFDSYMKEFFKDSTANFYLEIEPFKPGREPSIEDIKAAADYLEVPLTENLWMPYANPNGEPLRTTHPVPVGLRLAQLKIS